MPRFIVVGNVGSGHRKEAENLAHRLGLKFIDLECIFWQPGWKLASIAERRKSLGDIAAEDSWVVAGFADQLWQVADEKIVIQKPKLLCFLSYLWRSLPFLFKSRPGMPKHCPEVLGLYANTLRIWQFDSKPLTSSQSKEN